MYTASDTKLQNNELTCPITLQTIRNPVIAKDGYVYEKSAISEWVLKHGTSPLTREPLKMDELLDASHPNLPTKQHRDSLASSNMDDKMSSSSSINIRTEIKSIKKCNRWLFIILILILCFVCAGVIIGGALLFRISIQSVTIKPENSTYSTYSTYSTTFPTYTATYSSQLTSNGPTFNLNNGQYASYYYEAIQLIAPQTGSYEFSCFSSFNSSIYFYNNSFNPLSPIKNLLNQSRTIESRYQVQSSILIRSSDVYYLVITSKTPWATGSFSIMFTGPSHIKMNYSAIPSNFCAKPEVHVIGIYETKNSIYYNRDWMNSATVTIERPGEQILVLSSYKPMYWFIKTAFGVKLSTIYLISYYEQKVRGSFDCTDNVNVISLSGACGYSYPPTDNVCDTNQLLELIRKRVGGEVTSFHGCYRASEWRIDKNFRATSNCATSDGCSMSAYYSNCVV